MKQFSRPTTKLAHGKPAARTDERKLQFGAAPGSVAGDTVMCGPYPDKLVECDECGVLKPWIMMHDSKESSLLQVCQKCHEQGH